jgi:sirohydrochlorin ferrochelatase
MPTDRTSRSFHRVVLVPASPAGSRDRDGLVRRYRLARVRCEGREATGAEAPRSGANPTV